MPGIGSTGSGRCQPKAFRRKAAGHCWGCLNVGKRSASVKAEGLQAPMQRELQHQGLGGALRRRDRCAVAECIPQFDASVSGNPVSRFFPRAAFVKNCIITAKEEEQQRGVDPAEPPRPSMRSAMA